MSGFTDFLKNSVGSLIGLLPAALSSNYRKKLFGTGLTAAEKEANLFESQQAERQMMFQQQMSNTQYQRGVADMQNAGLNPALMYGNGASGASSPAGAMAASESPSQLDPVGLIGQLANLALLRSQKRNIDADTEKKISESDLTKQNIVNAAASLGEIRSRVKGLDLTNEAQEIINSYLDRKEKVALENMTLEGNKLAAEWSAIQQKIANLHVEKKKVLQDIIESRQRVANLIKQGKLTDAQIAEISSTIRRIDQETSNLVKTGVLTDKEIDFYEWNHGESISGLGVNPGARYIPDSKYRNKNR